MTSRRIEAVLGRCRAQILSHLHGDFVSGELIRAILTSYDHLVAELAHRPPITTTTGTELLGFRQIGRVCASYARLVAVFGPPDPGDGANIDVLWSVPTPLHGIAIIYNWKNGRVYHGADGLDVTAMTEWEVGGLGRDGLAFVQDRIDRVI